MAVSESKTTELKNMIPKSQDLSRSFHQSFRLKSMITLIFLIHDCDGIVFDRPSIWDGFFEWKEKYMEIDQQETVEETAWVCPIHETWSIHSVHNQIQ